LEDDPPVDDDFELDLEAVDVVSSAPTAVQIDEQRTSNKEIFRGYR